MKVNSLCLLLLVLTASCAGEADRNATKENEVGKPPAAVYADYQVWAEEGGDDVTVRLQFRRGGEEGVPFAVDSPGRVLLDGEELSPDSTTFMGAYYEVFRPVENFAGEHTIVFVDKQGGRFTSAFRFEPFTLAKELPQTLPAKPFVVHLQSFPDTAVPVRLVMVDTSFTSDGVNEKVMAVGGRIEVTEQHLSNLTKGPVTLEIYKEEEKVLPAGTNKTGKFTLHYGLRRHFTLVN